MERSARKSPQPQKSLPPYGTWLPMESAPRDGQKILIYTRHGDYEISAWHLTQCWASKRGFYVDAAMWTSLPRPPAN